MSDETDTRTFAERQRDAAVEEQRRIGARDAKVADVARGNGRGVTIGEVVVIEDGDGEESGAFVVERTAKDGAGLWLAVNDGKRLPMGWYRRELAILHLLSVRYGDGDDMGTAARHAGRVLGINDQED